MFDPDYLKAILQAIGDNSYLGIANDELMKKIVIEPEGETPVGKTLGGQKFKYHMDEAWNAGLIKPRDFEPGEHTWGLRLSAGGHWGLSVFELVLTPVGGEFLEGLNKNRSFERLKAALRNAGAQAGTEALKAAVAAFLRASF